MRGDRRRPDRDLEPRTGDRRPAGSGSGPAVLPLLLLLFVAAGIGAGCAGSRSSGDSPFAGGGAREEPVRLTVHNRNFKDATIWAHWRGTRVRVGRVGGNSTETFEMRYRNDHVRFEVDFLAGGGYVGEGIDVRPGDRLELVIRPNG